ncbi:TatD family hydrolase [Serpentinicella sp. ANB-PHB4]|uniref:amidohydrolase family protein n=1 Tax=Serpentinicella sp. ANB-PHB4 TaxID=3074076 RepID=UPI0028569BF3|nr:TatD family hydrolase [Serpentinicella sp. ANB-PHB4]MDR5659671.1 TatD family hydrolase [Serpentinicella sp. ANB-PHB4]
MQIIDAHLHFSAVKRFINCASKISKENYSVEGLEQLLVNNNIVYAVGMGIEETSNKAFPDHLQSNPMGLDLNEQLPSKIRCCIGINPMSLKKNFKTEIKKIIESLKSIKVIGIKLYPGYYPVSVTDPIYEHIFELAKEYQVPIVIHCGKTYAIKGYLNESHPLNVNQVALRNPSVKFIIAHLGDPWVMDTAAIISNNDNVYADLSGLIVGDEKAINKRSTKYFVEHIQRALDYANSYDKILYGSDWPLVTMEYYIDWIKQLIPSVYHKKVFFDNALNVYSGLKIYI